MRRDLNRLADEAFDLLVIGGGITGAAIARDAALRGLSVALIEKNDFAHATSAHNSKLIHGGLRYLRNLEFGLVRESLKERRIWQRIAPHLVRPLPFLVPIFDRHSRLALSAGLWLYDFLSFDRTWLDDPDQRLTGHDWLGRSEALATEPRLESGKLEGAFRYPDAQMYSPERLALECVLDAAAHGAAPANHVEACSLIPRGDRIEGASARDTLTGETFGIRAKFTILAVGPWADRFLSRALNRAPSHKLLLSKGIHLIVPRLTRTHALTVAANGGHFFVLPWRSGTILGTTDTRFEGSPDEVAATEAEIAAFLEMVHAHLPAVMIERNQVRHAYAGLRPLIDDGAHGTYGASRRAELVDHARSDNLSGLISAIGGKWTTSRDLARRAVDTAIAKLGQNAQPCTTAARRLPGGAIDRIAQTPEGAEALPNPDHVARLYGSRLPLILDIVRQQPSLGLALASTGDIGAQIVLATREEMALTLEDVVLRRTGLGQEGNPGLPALEAVATIMATELHWSETRKRAEIDAVATSFS
jgi:glycerol-3-phosphate dehydrogenase